MYTLYFKLILFSGYARPYYVSLETFLRKGKQYSKLLAKVK